MGFFIYRKFLTHFYLYEMYKKSHIEISLKTISYTLLEILKYNPRNFYKEKLHKNK